MLNQCITQVYLRASFHPQTIIMDMEFNKVCDKLPSLIINMTAACKHVTEIKQKFASSKNECVPSSPCSPTQRYQK